MSEKIDKLLAEIKELTLLEAAELVKIIEDTFHVQATIKAVPFSGTMGMESASPKTEEIEEKTEFNVMLEDVPSDKKIPILKVVRILTGLGLKEAKGIVESAPKQILESLNKDSAEDAKKQLESAGAKVSLT